MATRGSPSTAWTLASLGHPTTWRPCPPLCTHTHTHSTGSCFIAFKCPEQLTALRPTNPGADNSSGHGGAEGSARWLKVHPPPQKGGQGGGAGRVVAGRPGTWPWTRPQRQTRTGRRRPAQRDAERGGRRRDGWDSGGRPGGHGEAGSGGLTRRQAPRCREKGRMEVRGWGRRGGLGRPTRGQVADRLSPTVRATPGGGGQSPRGSQDQAGPSRGWGRGDGGPERGQAAGQGSGPGRAT